MSGFSNVEQDHMWGKEDTFYMDEGDLAYHQDQLKFQQYEQSSQYPPNVGGNIYSSSSSVSQNAFLDPSAVQYRSRPSSEDLYGGSISSLGSPANYTPQTEVDDQEPPLLEELGIDPDRILEKTMAVLNPFRRRGPTDDINFLISDADLAGPLVFCLALGACLLFGGKVHFGYVYGLAVICCLMMYCLLSLMTTTSPTVTLISVASVLGYCILPVVALSALGIFLSLRNGLGLILALVAVAWCSLSASRLFVTMMCETGQRPLIAYPCALLYGLPVDASQIHQPLLVCTAHIHWDPEFCDVKLIQTMMLSNELKSILEDASHSFRPGHKPETTNIQLLLCGDFNSLPDSGVIEFLTSGRVPADHKDFKSLVYKTCLQKISGCEKPNEFTHSFKLASAYSEDIMPFTNYTFDFKGIIDYIFYSKQSMTPLGLLGPLAQEWLKDNKVVGCPHPHVPSDHFPLLVELEMLPTVPAASNGLITRR